MIDASSIIFRWKGKSEKIYDWKLYGSHFYRPDNSPSAPLKAILPSSPGRNCTSVSRRMLRRKNFILVFRAVRARNVSSKWKVITRSHYYRDSAGNRIMCYQSQSKQEKTKSEGRWDLSRHNTWNKIYRVFPVFCLFGDNTGKVFAFNFTCVMCFHSPCAARSQGKLNLFFSFCPFFLHSTIFYSFPRM